MPHYKDGTEAKVGDLVFGPSHTFADPIAGYVLDITPGSDTCNMHVGLLAPTGGADRYYDTIISIGAGLGYPRSNFQTHAAICNCRDFVLLYRKDVAPAPALDAAPYGYCPVCHAPGELRERRPDSNDTCANGHTYPSRNAVKS